MKLIADILLVAGALSASFYCYILARRLSRFNDLETGVGGAVAILSIQVDDLTKTLDAAQTAAGTSGATLEELTHRAEDLTHRAETVAKRLELILASMHDLPDAQPDDPRPKASIGPIFRRHDKAGVAQ